MPDSPPDSVTIRVPGTSANIGPGYDCMGLALDLSNRVTITRLPSGAKPIEQPHRMVQDIAEAFFSEQGANVAPFPFSWEIGGDVPISRGLGSSVTLRLGVLMGLNELSGQPLNKQRLFEICSTAEGHPDNVAPAVFGGFVLANGTNWFRFPVQEPLKAVLLIPDTEVQTAHARAALPPSVPHSDAARNTANACTIVAAFATGLYQYMGKALQDFLHQPYRQHLVPGMFEAIEAGFRAGAIGGYLSGSGSTIACLTCEGKEEAIGKAMQEALTASGLTSRIVIVGAENEGAQVVA